MAEYRIKSITLARVLADKGAMTYLSYYGEKIWRPYVFWIIEGGDKKILVDTAIHAADYKGFASGFKNLPIEHVNSFGKSLAEKSIAVDEIDIIIQTHLHFDHCFNTHHCKNAEVVVQKKELAFANNPHPVFAPMYSKKLLKEINFLTVDGYTEILPGIEVIPVPGHTPGCQAVSIMTKKGRAVISGFCSILENFFPPEDIKERISPFSGYPVIIPGINYNALEAYESILKIKKLADIVLPMHEPSLMDTEEI